MEDKKIALIKSNLNSIIQIKFANDESELSVDKLKKLLTDVYNIDIDDNLLSDLLSDNPNVKDITGDKITLGTKENQEEENLDDEIHDTAVEQASDDLSDGITFESVADALNGIKTGLSIDSSKINLSEDNLYYHLHKGALKEHKNYIVSDIIPKQKLEESVVKCKIDKSFLFIELPIECFVNKS